MQKIIEFADKVALNENADIPEENKVTDDNINEIKSIVNGSLQGTNAMGSIVVDDVKCKNMFNKNSWSKNYINSSTGVVTSSNNTALFNYIKVVPAKTYSISLATTVLDYRISYYTANKTWISTSSTYTTGTTITIPSNCEYIRIYINVDGNGIDQTKIDSLNFQAELGEATSYTPYQDIGNDEMYNESETRIGTWFGNDLYRKVFTITSLTSSNTNLVDVSGLSIDFAKISGTIITSTGAKFPINLYDSASNYSSIFLSDTGYIRGRGVVGSGTLIKCIVILEYTKTTSGTRMLSAETDEENR